MRALSEAVVAATSGPRNALTAVVTPRAYSLARPRTSCETETYTSGASARTISATRSSWVGSIVHHSRQIAIASTPLVDQFAHDRAGRFLVQRPDHPAEVVDPLRDLAHQRLVNDRVALDEAAVVLEHLLLEAESLVAAHDRQRVAKPLGEQHAGHRAAALDQGVGRDRRAVREQPNAGDELLQFDASIGCGQRERVEHAGHQLARRGRRLVARDRTVGRPDHRIGERSAYVRCNNIESGVGCRHPSPLQESSTGTYRLRCSAVKLVQ